MTQESIAPVATDEGKVTEELAALATLVGGDKPTRIVALIPAHNEQDGIVKTVRSLYEQTVKPDLVIVMADNCTDDTIPLARSAGAYVVATVNNRAKKAGALNQGIALTMPWMQETDYYILQDADGELSPDWIKNALATYAGWDDEPGRKKPLGGLSGAIVARKPQNFIERAQAIEYARGTRLMARKRGKVHVLSGAAAMLPVSVLQQVAAARGTTLPGNKGVYYMEDSLTEDYELTLAIRHLGYDCTSTKRCQVVTDLMPDVHMLEIQRVRWYRGAMESLAIYKFNRLTARTWGGVAFTLFSSTLFPIALVGLVFSYLIYHSLPSPLFWVFLPIFMLENIIVAYRVDRKSFWTAVSFVPLFLYDNAMFIIYWRSLFQALRRQNRVWIT